MSYMSALDAAGITVEKMSAYLEKHPEISFDEALTVIGKRHTVIGVDGRTCGHKHRYLGRATDCFDRIVDQHLWGDIPEPSIITR